MMETRSALSATVSELFNGANYVVWSVQVKTYLIAQDLWDIVEGTDVLPKPGNKAALKVRTRKNAMALHVIQTSCEPRICLLISQITSAKLAWDALTAIKDLYKVFRGDNIDWEELTYVVRRDSIKRYLRRVRVWDIVQDEDDEDASAEDDEDYDDDEDDEIAGADDDEVASAGNNEIAGSEDNEVVGVENNEAVGAEDNEVAGAESTEVAAGAGDNEVAGAESNEVAAGAGNHEIAGADDNEVTGAESNEVAAGAGDNEVAGAESNEVAAGAGNNEVAGADDNEVAGAGNNEDSDSIKKNAKALYLIMESCGSKRFSLISNTDSAKEAWRALKDAHDEEMFGKYFDSRYGPGS